GDYVSIAGPSGCGKTTLLSILGLLDTPTEGSYLLEDRSVANLSPADRARIRNRRIGFIFQAFNLIGDLTVYENVELPLTYRGMATGGMVTHDPRYAQHADRTVQLFDGRVVEEQGSGVGGQGSGVRGPESASSFPNPRPPTPDP